MAQGKGKIKGWITKNGQHIPIYDHYTAEPSPRLKNAKIKANRANAIDPSTIKTSYDVEELILGKQELKDSYINSEEYKEAADVLNDSFNKRDELDNQIQELAKALESESRIPTKEEMPGFSKWEREMFTEYTDKGNEINKQIQSLREQKNILDKNISNATGVLNRLDEQAYRDQRDNWRGRALVPTDKTEFPGFQLDTTIPYYEELREKGEAFVVEMTPREYMERCAYQVFNASLERTVRGAYPDSVAKYAVMMNNGTKFHMPMLNLQDKEQEGRHRAVTAIVNGIEKIPVLVVPKKRGY